MATQKFDVVPLSEFESDAPMAARAPARFQQQFDVQSTGEPYQAPRQGAPMSGEDKSWLYKLAEAHPEITQKLGQGAKSINETIGTDYWYPEVQAAGMGITQGAEDVGSSLANLIPGVDIQPQNLKERISPDPVSHLLFEGGRQAAPLAAYASGEGALGMIPRLGGQTAKAVMTRGALSGAAIGEQEPGGRAGAAALGGALSLPLGLPTRKIADNILKRSNAVKKSYSMKYGDYFDKAQRAGINDIQKPTSVDIDTLDKLPANLKKHLGSLKQYAKNPSLEKAHAAQSDLGLIQRNFKPISNEERATANAVDRARKRVTGDALMELSKQGRGDLAREYRSIQEGYKRDVVPYLDQNIKKYKNKKITSNSLVKKLEEDPEFEITARKHHPDLLRRKLVEGGTKTAKKALLIGIGSALGAGGILGHKKIFNDSGQTDFGVYN